MSLKNSSSYGFPEETPQPRRQSNSEAILILLLAVGALLIVLRVPGVNAVLRKEFSRATHRPALDFSAMVWANKDAGVYYCSGNKLYGSGTGSYMKQGDALTAGYQPVLGNYCSPGKPASSRENVSAKP